LIALDFKSLKSFNLDVEQIPITASSLYQNQLQHQRLLLKSRIIGKERWLSLLIFRKICQALEEN
jgi:hypothetical protein